MLYLKIAAGLFAAVFIAWAGRTLYMAGYDSARAELLEAREARESVIAARFVKAVDASERQRADALAELNELRRRPPVVITDVQTKTLNATCAAALTLIFSACSTIPDEQCPVSERAVEYIERRVPDALLVRCRPRLLQADHNPAGDPQAAVVVIRANNGRMDECYKMHDFIINHILRGTLMPGDSKPDLKKKVKKPTTTPPKAVKKPNNPSK